MGHSPNVSDIGHLGPGKRGSFTFISLEEFICIVRFSLIRDDAVVVRVIYGDKTTAAASHGRGPLRALEAPPPPKNCPLPWADRQQSSGSCSTRHTPLRYPPSSRHPQGSCGHCPRSTWTPGWASSASRPSSRTRTRTTTQTSSPPSSRPFRRPQVLCSGAPADASALESGHTPLLRQTLSLL